MIARELDSSLGMARPGSRLGSRPEVNEPDELDAFDRALAYWAAGKPASTRRCVRAFNQCLPEIEQAQTQISRLDLAQRKSLVQDLRARLKSTPVDTDMLCEVFALVRIAATQCLGLHLHDEQLMAGWCMCFGHLVEMQTGEGKTVAAALPAVFKALAGVPVLVITANEYLVARDARTLEPLYQWFDLHADIVLAAQDESRRASGYAADITYCTHQQVVFDYLRDQRALGACRSGLPYRLRTLIQEKSPDLLQRGLCFAIIDEADSVLIDDARTPLILAESTALEPALVAESAVALSIARRFEKHTHYVLNAELRSVNLTPAGHDLLDSQCESLTGSWQFKRYRQERLKQAIAALMLYRRDVDYLVNTDRIDLIDQSTGRTTPNRRMQHGMHRMLEVKERCSVAPETNPVSSLSFQSFFRRFHSLAGMSGTLVEARRELRTVYALEVIKIPAVRPERRHSMPSCVAATRALQLAATVRIVSERQRHGQPVLIGTRSVSLSEQVSEALRCAGIEHQLLNARQDTDEAQAIALAGQRGCVTVATNMAGRGTDIAVDEEVVQAGGLHVINLEINHSRRIDRQLHGRAARQGNPGSSQDLWCLDDEVLEEELGTGLQSCLRALIERRGSSTSALALKLARWAQMRLEARHQEQRLQVFKGQSNLQRTLAIGGQGD